jgi:hypothetical protein
MSWNEPDLGWWEKEEPEDLSEELETAGCRWTAEDEADMRVTDAQEKLGGMGNAAQAGASQDGWLFTAEDLKEIA